MKKLIVALLIVGALATVITVSQYRSKQQRLEVTVAEVIQGSLSDTILASGNLEFNTQIQIRSEITGRVIEVLVEEGEFVAEGQILMRLDPTAFEADVTRVRALLSSQEIDITRSQTVLNDLQRQYHQQQKLFSAGLIQQETIDSLKNQLELARINVASSNAALAQTQASLAMTEDNLRKTIYRAPISGLLSTVDVKPGETVIAGSTNIIGSALMTLADPSAILAEIRVDEADITNIRLGQQAQVFAAANPHLPVKGEVIHIATSARTLQQSQSLVFRVKVLLDSSGHTLFPGMSCRAEIIMDQRQDSLQIPIAAVQQQDNQPYVWVVKNDQVSKRNVSLGMANDITQEILTGLTLNEQVIIGPARTVSRLTEGHKVKASVSSRQGS